MKRKMFWLPALLALLPCACVDGTIHLDHVNKEVTILRNLEFPIGDFKELLLSEVIDGDISDLYRDADGRYSFDVSIDVDDISFGVEDVSFDEMEFHATVINTIPLDFSLSSSAFEIDGRPVEGATLTFDSGGDVLLRSGTLAVPSRNEIVLRMTCKGTVRYDEFDYTEEIDILRCENLTIHLSCKGHTGDGFLDEPLDERQGIHVTDTYLRVPSGVKL